MTRNNPDLLLINNVDATNLGDEWQLFFSMLPEQDFDCHFIKWLDHMFMQASWEDEPDVDAIEKMWQRIQERIATTERA